MPTVLVGSNRSKGSLSRATLCQGLVESLCQIIVQLGVSCALETRGLAMVCPFSVQAFLPNLGLDLDGTGPVSRQMCS